MASDSPQPQQSKLASASSASFRHNSRLNLQPPLPRISERTHSPTHQPNFPAPANPPPPPPPPPKSVARVFPRNELIILRDRWRCEGKIVVFTNGCYDLLHPGHIALLEQARSLGD